MTPKVSVIIPVYNAEKYLNECIDSVLLQDIEELEVICVNDCSTDSSLSILEEYKKKDNRIHIITNQTNLKAGVCRNIGLEHAAGEYIHFLDADDFLVPNVYSSMYEKAVSNSLDILRARAYDFDSSSLSSHTSAWSSLLNVATQNFDKVISFYSDPNVFTNVNVAPWGGFYRRVFLQENNILFNDLMCVNDRSFFAETIFKASRILFQDIYMMYYRVNNSFSLVGKRAKYFDCHFQSYNLIYEKSQFLPPQLRKLYLESELFDICYWLRLFARGEYGDIVIFEAKKFLDGFDYTLWGNEYRNSYWYKKMRDAVSLNHIECFETPISEPKISIIMPVYNSQKFLREAVTSVLTQSLAEFELICVDDGSSDDSLYILQYYAEIDKRVLVFSQKNKSAGVARNVGIEHAVGEYITFLDSDDVMMPRALERFYKRARSVDADIVISSAYRFTEYGKYNEVASFCLRKQFVPSGTYFSVENNHQYMFQLSSGAPWGKMYKRTLIEENKISFPALSRSEDVCFVYCAFAAAKRISTLGEKLIAYRIVAGSNSLEATKDRTPLAPVESYRILKANLIRIGKFEQTRQSFINALFSSLAYNMRTFNTVESFEALFNELRNNVIEEYEINLANADFFYNIDDYYLIKDIMDADSLTSFLFIKMKTGSMSASLQELNRIKSEAAQSRRKNEKDFYKNEVIAIRSSASYRIGRFITFIPRKIRGGIRCYKEHGVRYTMRRIKEKFRSLFRKKTHVK